MVTRATTKIIINQTFNQKIKNLISDRVLVRQDDVDPLSNEEVVEILLKQLLDPINAPVALVEAERGIIDAYIQDEELIREIGRLNSERRSLLERADHALESSDLEILIEEAIGSIIPDDDISSTASTRFNTPRNNTAAADSYDYESDPTRDLIGIDLEFISLK